MYYREGFRQHPSNIFLKALVELDLTEKDIDHDVFLEESKT